MHRFCRSELLGLSVLKLWQKQKVKHKTCPFFKKWRYTEGAEVEIHSFLTSALDGDEWFKRGQFSHQLSRKTDGLRSWSRRFGEAKNSFHPPGIETRINQPAALSLYWLSYAASRNYCLYFKGISYKMCHLELLVTDFFKCFLGRDIQQ